MTLAAERRGRGPRIVAVHGFTQSSSCWGPVLDGLAADHEVVAVDAPGHGRSAHDDATFVDAAALIGEVGGRGTYLGYSMGGRLCLRLACDRPDLVERLVLIGATAGIDDPAERAARRRADDALAEHLEAVGVDAFLDEWLALPLFAGLDHRAQARPQRRLNRPEGLAGSLRRCGTGAQDPLWDRLGTLTMPVLVTAGELDSKFVALGRRLAAGIGPSATFAPVPGAGHTAHLERPPAFLALLGRWLGSTQPPASAAASSGE